MNSILEKIRSAFARVHWPAAIAIGFIVLGAYILPDARLAKIEDLLTRDWSSIAASLTALIGLITLVQSRGLVKPDGTVSSSSRTTTTTESTRTVEDPPSRTEGSSTISPMLVVVMIALFAGGCALLLPGCGASAVSHHSTVAVIAGIAVESAEDIYSAHLDAVSDACGDEACVLAAREQRAPAEAAIGLARVAVATYRDAIEIANEAEESPDLIAALVTAALRLAARWGEVVRILSGLGVEGLPTIPGLGS